MKITDLVRQNQAVKQTAAATSATSYRPRTAAALEAVQEKTQQRIGAAERAGAAALAVSDSTKALDKGVAELQKLVTAAADPKATAADKESLQKKFTAAVAKVETATKQQTKDLAKEPLATAAVKPLDDATAKAVADLKTLDLRTASPDDVKAAGKVLESAKTQTGKQAVQADKLVAGFSRQITTLENAAANLGGTTSSVQQQRQAQVIAALSQPLQTNGSLVNLFA